MWFRFNSETDFVKCEKCYKNISEKIKKQIIFLVNIYNTKFINTISINPYCKTDIRISVKHWLIFFLFCFCLFRAAPMAYRGYQAKGPIRAVATSLCHSHSNLGSKPHLWPTPQLMTILNSQPPELAMDQIHVLKDTSQISFRCTTMGTPVSSF